MNSRKEGKPHGKKIPSRMDMGLDLQLYNNILPSFTHPKKISQVSEGLLSESLGKNVSSLLGGWAILQWDHPVMH